MFQGKGGAGRDHHIKGFSMWMAGGGIKGGISHGRTSWDHAEKDMFTWIFMPPCSIIGINHENLLYQGLTCDRSRGQAHPLPEMAPL